MLLLDIHCERDAFQLQVRESFSLNGVTGVMGPSGCGKTTLLRCIAGLERHVQGSVKFDSTLWQSEAAFVPPHKRGIGYVFQDGRLFPHMSVRSNLNYGLRRNRKYLDTASETLSFEHVVEWLGIVSLLDRPITRLSGGQRQRVAIGRALLGSPKLLLMDEPLSALDWASRTSIMPRLREINREFGVPVLFVSHNREEIARLADEVVLMDNGCIEERGPTRQMLNRARGSLADDQALSVLEAGVVNTDSPYGMTELEVDGRSLMVNQSNLRQGQQVRVVVPASEISLCLENISQISIQNRLLTTLTDIQDIDDHHALVRLTLDEQALIALITRQSRHRLGLKLGITVYAHFKAACLEVV
ncbi:molybdenum ABC transporter ATP-binding protein [Sansalvadorimonas verongulae]|uniref:molybdenum ABC transporter ATP-binding protein n=1 Tax=Sansalvadorimonas verongulae TaxID=2172824 RepID=UPI0012BC4A32|nr:molybdenum ABC transporter ATP-binding protein [Sansalvadorimonas verongulae]MTI15432.1 molybdenum ABC transporter ATP-binding protein [Sansalvadorimonas verongulae]